MVIYVFSHLNQFQAKVLILLFFHFTGHDCLLYQAFITTQWAGAQNIVYDQCYSSFANQNNLLEQHPYNHFSYSAFKIDDHTTYARAKENPAKGFYSFWHNYGFLSDDTNSTETAFWMIDLKEEIVLEKVVVVVMVMTKFFRNVVVRFGNSADYMNNIEIPYPASEIRDKTPLVIKPDFSISGTYLSFESDSVQALAIGPVQVFKK